jgi:simple sugar transport system substrate-binding protein
VALVAMLVGALTLAACDGADDNGTPEEDATRGQDGAYTFAWISHGSEGDPFWPNVLRAANKAADDLGVELESSFHQNDVADQKEAFAAVIAAGVDGIATTSPDPDVLTEEVAQAQRADIPVVFFNTDDPGTGRTAYVGGNLFQAGQEWANYLVRNDLVQNGDSVWLPVEVPGATYQKEETRGIASVFDPRGIEYEVFDAKFDPAESRAAMTEFLSARGNEIDAVIGLGDLVMANIKPVFDEVGWEPGQVPVVGWGNTPDTTQAVQEGYVNAATWQYPDSQGYLPIVFLFMIKEGSAIGYDVSTLTLYDESTVDRFADLAEQFAE